MTSRMCLPETAAVRRQETACIHEVECGDTALVDGLPVTLTARDTHWHDWHVRLRVRNKVLPSAVMAGIMPPHQPQAERYNRIADCHKHVWPSEPFLRTRTLLPGTACLLMHLLICRYSHLPALAAPRLHPAQHATPPRRVCIPGCAYIFCGRLTQAFNSSKQAGQRLPPLCSWRRTRTRRLGRRAAGMGRLYIFPSKATEGQYLFATPCSFCAYMSMLGSSIPSYRCSSYPT